MSLRVWLPLNGDLHNQGLDNISVTNSDATVNTSGKIGSCYSFGTSASGMNITNYNFSQFSECSISIWLKIISWNTNYATYVQLGTNGRSWANYIFGVLRGASASKLAFVIGNTSSTTTTNCLTSELELNTWYHFAFVYKNGNMKIYKNGALDTEYTTSIVPAFGSISKISLGRANDNGYQSNCLMNDFRIYDHALSELEVKEIARGLILHYPLNNNGMGNKNLLTNDWNLTAWSKESGISVSWDDTVGMYKVLDSSHISSRWGIYQNITLTANTTYTFSVDGMKKDQNVNFGFAEGTSWPANAGSFTTTVSRLSKTITVGSADANCRIYLNINPVSNGSNYGYFRAPKLEIGSVATPWGSHTDNNVEYDISGYCNNGTKVGTFTYSTDTPKYGVSTSFDGTTNCIQVPYNTICPDNIFTFNLWFKKDDLGPKSYETLFGGPSGFEMDSRQNNQSTLSLYMASTRSGKRNLVTELTFNTWYMVTMVRDGIKERYYINGIFQSEIDAKSMPTGIYRIGAWASNTGQNYYGNISDFRIYATALSAQDILSLYHNSALVDEQGIIHGAIH